MIPEERMIHNGDCSYKRGLKPAQTFHWKKNPTFNPSNRKKKSTKFKKYAIQKISCHVQKVFIFLY